MACAGPMPALARRIAQAAPGGMPPRANHPVRPAADHPLRDEPAKTRRAAPAATGPGQVVPPGAPGAAASPGTKGATGMTTRPGIITQDLPAVPAVRGHERERPAEP